MVATWGRLAMFKHILIIFCWLQPPSLIMYQCFPTSIKLKPPFELANPQNPAIFRSTK